MTFRRPPLPGKDLGAWARQMYEYMSSQSPVQGSVDPTPLLLAHLTDGQTARAATDGVLLFDPVAGEVVVSIGGAFVTLGPYTLSLPDVITAGSAGDADTIPQITVDAKGRVTALSQIDVSIAAAKINDSTAAGRAMLVAADAAAQTALLDVFTTALKGLVPSSGGGTANYLRADGSWAQPPQGRVLLATKTAAASATIDFTEFNNSLYSKYYFRLDNFKPATDGVELLMRFSSDGGSTYDSAAGNYSYANSGEKAGVVLNGSLASATAIRVARDIGNAATDHGVCGEVALMGAADNAVKSCITSLVNVFTTTDISGLIIAAGSRLLAQDTTAARFLFSSGNAASGTIRMYGEA